MPVIREALHAIDPALGLANVMTMDQVLDRGRAAQTFLASMLGVFAWVALTLAAVGLYAVTAYGVAQRTREIGIRMALGARRTQVAWLFMRRVLVQVLVGLAFGLTGAVAVGKLLQSYLLKTDRSDPVTFAMIIALLVFVSLAACYFPTRRATRLNPSVSLRYE